MDHNATCGSNEPSRSESMIEEKAAGIKLLILDVDGVLTDGSITYDELGRETKSFNTKDGLGLKMVMAGGIEVAIVTSRESNALVHRANDLGIKELHQGVSEKMSVVKKITEKKGLRKSQVCCIGDDLPDMAMFREAGLAIAVADAAKEVRDAADLVTKNNGGSGAVREACEWLLKHQGKWKDLLFRFSGK